MNKRVFVSMVVLVVVFLLGMYILKFFFPEQFLFAIENNTIIEIGNYIDSHAWAAIIFYTIIGVIFDWLYFGAVCKMTVLKPTLIVVIFAYNISNFICSKYAPVEFIEENSLLFISINTCYMVLIPMFFTKSIKELSITYCVNNISQALSILIRNIAITTANSNALTAALLSFDNYLWLLLCFVLFNYKKENKYGQSETVLREQKEQILREENRESRKGNQETE